MSPSRLDQLNSSAQSVQVARHGVGGLGRICDSLNDERGTGGSTRLAHLLGWNPSTIRRKLVGESKITKADEPAISQVIAEA